MSIVYSLELPPFSPSLVAELAELCEAVFGLSDLDLQWRLGNMPCPSVFSATSGSQLVAFKAGYAMSQSKYYSWLGGVRPEFRRHGIASKLMESQHQWLQGWEYKCVETAANQENLAMCQLNLKHGFVVCGLRHEPHRVQVLFSKSLV